MKKLPDNIETLLTSQKEVGLSVTERDVMFSELQAFTTLHAPAAPGVQSPLKRPVFLFSKWSIAIASVFLVTVGTGVASTQSLPGDVLYEVKVSVVEPVIGFGQFGTTEQLVYQLELMERRVSEMETLYKNNELTESEVLVLETQIEEQANTFEEFLTEIDSVGITAEDSLDAVSTVSVALRKQAFLADKKFGTERPSELDVVQAEIDNLYQEELVEFVAATPAAVPEYVESLLEDISNQVAIDPEVASSSAVELGAYLEDVETTLEAGDLKQAVEFAEEAQSLLETNSFFDTVDESPVKEDNEVTDPEVMIEN